MAVSNNTIKTRIQLKSDTEANWNIANIRYGASGFVPLEGELIIYSADDTHSFSRLKVGDGSTNVVDLPFIDAGTLNGEETEIEKKENFQAFPSPGSPNKLYVDLSTKTIYHYDNNSGYTKLSNFNFSVTKSSIGNVISWSPGIRTEATIDNGTFKVANGLIPELLWEQRQVVTDVTKEGIV